MHLRSYIGSFLLVALAPSQGKGYSGIVERSDFEKRVRRGFWSIVLSYAFVGTTWILTTDFLVARSFDYADGARRVEVAKGLFYVATTASLLLILLMRLKKTLISAFASRSEARQRLNAIVDSPLIGIAVWHIDGRMLEVNDSFLNLWGYSREQFLEEQPSFKDLSPPENLERDLACLRSAVSEGMPGPYVKELLRRDGTKIAVLTGVTAKSRDATEGILFLLDDTERRQAVDERERTLAGLERIVEGRTRELALANQDLEAFSYSVSHDLRAPLRSIDSMAAMAEAELTSDVDEAKRLLGRVHTNVQRMSNLIDSLIRLSQISRKPLQQETVDLTSLIYRISRALQEANPNRTVNVKVQPGLLIVGDSELLESAFQNLLENAWKFTASKPVGEIVVSGNSEMIIIRDNGLGFDPYLADKIFRPFSRLHEQEGIPGTGIGLAIVERIVRSHGWHIQAVGHPGDGAEFRMIFAQYPGPVGTGDSQEPV